MATEKRLIDANALDSVLEDFERRYKKALFALSAQAIANARQIVYAMRTVDAVEVVHGRWIHDQVEGSNPFVDSLPIWFDVMQCSVCKEYIEGSHGTNYCPNCGAKMRGSEE